MTDFDLDRLGDVWRAQPDPAEIARLQRTAMAVSRRARWSQVVDIGAAIAVIAVVIFLVASNPKAETVLIGSAAVLVLLYSNVRLRRVRQVELKSLTGSTEEMLNQSIDRIDKTIRYNRFSLFAMGPGLLVGVLVAAAAVEKRGGASIFGALYDEFAFLYLWRGVTIALLVGGVVFVSLAIRRGRRELERLVEMRNSYRQEHESSSS